MVKHSEQVQKYLHHLYQHAHQPAPQRVSDTYGEILHESITHLFSHITLADQDVFYDLGSGVGKLALQFFLQTEIKRAVGIELSPVLHEQALRAKQQTRLDLPLFFENREVEFILGNFLEIPLTDATVAFLCAPCYTQQMMNSLGNIIENTRSIHTVLSLRPLITLKRLSLNRIVRVEGTWDSSLCYIYA